MKPETEGHTPGPWRVYVTKHPATIGKFCTETRIGTEDDHPQLHAPLPVVTMSYGAGVSRGFISIRKADADLISAAPELLAGLEHVISCRECYEFSWDACREGRDAKAAVAKAYGAVPAISAENVDKD